MIATYLKEIAAKTQRGDAREESYYSILETFLKEYSQAKLKKKIEITVLPKKTEAGNPDFRIWDGVHSQVGYIEAKPPTANLDDIEESEQLQRYIETFPNLILTNFYEFRLYRRGKLLAAVLLARPFVAAKGKIIPPAEHTEDFFALLEKFFQFSIPEDFTAETLARELASRTRFLRDQVITAELREASTPGAKKILGFYEAFQKHLIANLKPEQFADLYAQTITYGLFAARTRADGSFNRKIAYDLIPKTIGILREIFHFISFDPPEQLQATVDDIAEVLAAADVKKILHQYFDEGKGSDPIFHFYETFLAEYNPQERERRGVYYTPEPVVSYIVRSLNIILKEKFGREDGFATPSVTVLDPAGGTLTFLAEAAKLAVEEFVSKYGDGSRRKFIEDHILKHFYAFELMMAPYAAGHLKMGYLLEELGHKLSGDERFQFYLTNTLEMEELVQTSLPGMSSLSEESHLAGQVKKKQPILVVLGNPPYSGHSVNKGEWISELIETYKKVDGKPLGEKNPKWLQDDYVKFIRFAQWKIDQVGEGVLGFITNHSYLDNPTFRGMRQSLMNSFDEIYLLDLHGNSLKKEKAPDLPAPRSGLFWVYVLKCKDESFYIGQTDNIRRRFDEHLKGEVSWTKSRLPIEIIHLEELSSREESVKREQNLKTGFGRKWLKREYEAGRLMARQAGGSKDENVFDIQQGVAIGLFVKKKKHKGEKKIFHADLWGLREQKYKKLTTLSHKTVKWKQFQPSSPLYLFVPRDEKRSLRYQAYPSVPEIFPVNSVGIVTARDNFVIDFDRRELKRRITQFTESSLDDIFIAKTYDLKNTGAWKLRDARKALFKDEDWKDHFTKLLYRPFDVREIFYHDALVERSRKEVMQHMMQENLALLLTNRHPVGEYNDVFVGDKIVEGHVLSGALGISYVVPLYLYPERKKSRSGGGITMMLFEPEVSYGSGKKIPNIAPKIFEMLTEAYKKQPSPEDIFYYIYGVLYSNAYRQKYAEFLKTDFPRVPFTSSHKVFKSLAEKGEALVALHLLKSKKLGKSIARCEGKGDNRVEKVTYDEKKKRVHFNPVQYFTGVAKEVWEYHIGGYQVAAKWLKDRKGRVLSSEEVSHYCKVVTALAETMKVQKSLAELFEIVEKNIIEINKQVQL